MKKIHLLLLLLFCTCSLFAQEKHSRAEVRLYDKTINELGALGVEVDHGIHVPYRSLTSDFSKSEIAMMRAEGFHVDVLIEDVTAYYTSPRETSNQAALKMDDCNDVVVDNPYPYTTPDNYAYGSMGGYYTYEEMIEELDQMHAQYPHLINEISPIEDFVTVDGNQVFWLRMSNTPDIEDDSKPEVLYTSLHHAREPNSLSQMIFYLWYMLENYGSDPYVTFLVDHVEMYFIPCVNPDGYKYNQLTNPNGGGNWRKNRHVHHDGLVVGVDLNRNYGFEWGFDDVGSSTNPNSNTYRGPEPFSEIETQAVAALCNAHEFKLALNYHSFGNLLINPWGYNDLPTEEDNIFKAFGLQLNEQNDFLMGTATETVGYTVNGVSDDWFYGEEGTKPKIYTYTPEVGDDGIDGFWPDQSRIDLLNRSTMLMNQTLAHLAANKVEIKDLNPNSNLLAFETAIDVNARMLGLSGGEYAISLVSQNDYAVVNSPARFVSQEFFEDENVSFDITIDTDTPFDELLKFDVLVEYGTFTDTFSVERVYIGSNVDVSVLFQDQLDEDSQWMTDQWSITTADFISAPSSYTDSESGNYGANENNRLSTVESIDLVGVEKAELKFWAKWDIENDFDYVQFRAVRATGEVVPLCGLYTNPGADAQMVGEPLYDGVQNDWVQETIDLSDFVGQQITLEFILRSDGFVEGDGFYFDNIEVNSIAKGASNTTRIDFERKLAVYPNPNNGLVHVHIDNYKLSSNFRWNLSNGVGELISNGMLDGPSSVLRFTDLHPGIYFLEVLGNETQHSIRKLIIE